MKYQPRLVLSQYSAIIRLATVTQNLAIRSRHWLEVGLPLLLLVGYWSARAAEPRRVLVVHSFANAAPPFTTASTAFETTLTEEMGEPIDLDEISLDVARYATLDIEEALVELMNKRQTRWQPDLVVPIGSPSGVFIARHRDRLFPATTPIIYTGMDRRRLPPGALEHNATYIGASYDLAAAVEGILQLVPDTTNIVMVIGATPLEHFWVEVMRREFAVFTNRVSFTWFNDLSFEQVLHRSARLPQHSFIFLPLYLRDASGVTHNANDALRRLRAVANAPINGLFDEQLGLGIVGGWMYSDGTVGRESARIAVRLLRGEAATNSPPRTIPPASPQYDWRELQRWNISEDRLPVGSTILFREPTFWDRYQPWIIAGLSVCAAQGLLIAGLLLNRARRRRAEESLRERGNHLRTILDTAIEGIVTIDERGVIESVNVAAERMFGYPAAELTGRNVSLLLPPIYREEPDRYLAILRKNERRPVTGMGGEFSGQRKDGSVFPIDLAVSEIVLNGRRVFTGLVRDITERKEAERAARELSGRLLVAQESERARLARELHDDITQRLAVLAIDAGRVEGMGTDSAATETMRGVREGLVRLSEDVHTLSYRLHSSLLEDLGLAEALKAECERFTRQESIPCDLKQPDLAGSVPSEAALCLFRVAQEALRNVARHARASAVEITLRRLDDGLQLAVRDNGAGFDPAIKRERVSLGLAGMRERTHLLGGELDIESSPGQGATIVAWVPLKGEAP